MLYHTACTEGKRWQTSCGILVICRLPEPVWWNCGHCWQLLLFCWEWYQLHKIDAVPHNVHCVHLHAYEQFMHAVHVQHVTWSFYSKSRLTKLFEEGHTSWAVTLRRLAPHRSRCSPLGCTLPECYYSNYPHHHENPYNISPSSGVVQHKTQWI